MKDLQQVSYNNDLILTTEQLAEFYGTTSDRIKQNFNANKDKFVEGKHFYFLEGQSLRKFKDQVGNYDLVGKRASSIYLWTKRGASRHSKMLGTDKAWDMYDMLEDVYFNLKQYQLPQTTDEKIELLLESSSDKNKRLTKAEKRIDKLENDQPLAPGEYNYIGQQTGRAVSRYIKAHHLVLTNQQRSKLFKDINSGVKEITGIKTRTQLRKKHFKTVDEFINNWTPSTATLTVIKQMAREAEGQTELV